MCLHTVYAIKECCSPPMQVLFNHVLWECNGAIDILAKGVSMQQGLVSHIDPPWQSCLS